VTFTEGMPEPVDMSKGLGMSDLGRRNKWLLAACALPFLLIGSCGVDVNEDVGAASQNVLSDCLVKRPYAWFFPVGGTCSEVGGNTTERLVPGETETFEAAGGPVHGDGMVTITCDLNGDGKWTESMKTCSHSP